MLQYRIIVYPTYKNKSKKNYQNRGKIVDLENALCYYLPHEDKCKRGKNK